VLRARAIAIETTNTNQVFLKTTSSRLLAFDKAIHPKQGQVVRAYLDDERSFFGSRKSNDRVGGFFDGPFNKYPDLGAVHASCDR